MHEFTEAELDQLDELLGDIGPTFSNPEWWTVIYDEASEPAVGQILRRNFKEARPDRDYLSWWLDDQGVGVARFRRQFVSNVELARLGRQFGQGWSPAQIAEQGCLIVVGEKNAFTAGGLLVMLITRPDSLAQAA